MHNKDLIKKVIKNSVVLGNKILSNKTLLDEVHNVSEEIIKAFKSGNKVLICGNGGSASQAQHIAAEFSGKFYLDRDPLFADALHGNTSFLTAVANDYSYDEVYSRAVKAMGRPGDVLIGLTTSGNSKNIIKAIEKANSQGMITVGFTGQGGGKVKGLSKYLISIPSNDTPRVQEAHLVIGHTIAQIVEKEFFKKVKN